MSTPGGGRGRGRGRGKGRGRGGQRDGQQRRNEGGQRPGRQQREREEPRIQGTQTPARDRTRQDETYHLPPSGEKKAGGRETGRASSDRPALIPAKEEIKPEHHKPQAGPSSSITVEGMSREHNTGRGPQNMPSQSLGRATPLSVQPHTQSATTKQLVQTAPSSAGPVASRGSHPLPQRPGFGTQGRTIQLRANFFPVEFPRGTLYHYDIDIVPGKCPRRINRKVVEAIVKKYENEYFKTQWPSFDGKKNLYCREKLPIGDGRVELEVTLATDEGEKERCFKVAVKLAARVDLECLQDTLNDASRRLTITQALDVVFRHTPSLKYESVGRSFFSNAHSRDLGEGREVWFGYFQSLRPIMNWRFALNVDVAATVFYKEQSVLDFLCEVLRKDVRNPPTYLPDSDRVRFAKEVKGLRIVVTHLSYPRKYKVCGVTKSSASEQTFPLDNKGECTVERYFKETYKKSLQFPELPCLHVGSKERHVYIPIEFCKIVPGQHCKKKLSDYQTSQMIRQTVQPANEREKRILQNVRGAQFSSDPRLNDLGMTVSTRMMELTGHVLPQPTLTYQQQKTACLNPKQGAWNMEGKQFYQAVEIHTWAIVVLPHPKFCRGGRHFCGVDNFVRQLCQTSCDMGIKIRSNPEIHYMRPRDDVEQVFRGLCSRLQGIQLIIAVLDNEKGHGSSYNKVKSVGDNLIGIATQCILAPNVKKAYAATVSNLCLKINAKLGGVNTIIDPPQSIFYEPVIVMGADVTHPAPGDVRKPSIAAVTASMDRYASKYRADCSIQKHRQEIIADLETMTKGLLIEFFHATRGRKPRRIIFYRDGVSEGQFDDVVLKEVAAIQRACKSLQREDYEPGITFIVVQKRHHTRLFCSNERDAVGKGANVPPGTTVDRDITHPTDHDFYLCSHAAIQGTSRPCHYYVLWDDNNLSADDIQKLSYQLCHVFFRCNRSVSYPAPAYYAHHAAFHARALLQDWEDKASDSASTVSSASEVHMSKEEMARAVKVKEEIQKNMYFA